MDWDEAQFVGTASKLAEEEFSASFAEDMEYSLPASLYGEYRRAGRGMPPERWLRQRLREVFVCANQPPKWVEGTPIWPFFEGRPMVFIDQLVVPHSDAASGCLAPGVHLYVFGLRQKSPDGWRMQYRVIEQHPSLRLARDGDG